MSSANRLPRRAWMGLGVGLLATVASAHNQAPPLTITQVAEGHFGTGQGTMTLPNLAGEGLMVGVLLDESTGTRYMLDAKLTTFMPMLFGTDQPLTLGGIYGRLLEVPGGASQDAEPEFVGYVEGLWRLERNLTGDYEALVYRRSEAGEKELAGSIQGLIQVAVADGGVPAPMPRPPVPDWAVLDTGADGKGGDAIDRFSRRSGKGHVADQGLIAVPDVIDARSSRRSMKEKGEQKSAARDVRSGNVFSTPERPAVIDARSVVIDARSARGASKEKGEEKNAARDVHSANVFSTPERPAVIDARSVVIDARSGAASGSPSKEKPEAAGVTRSAAESGGTTVYDLTLSGLFQASFKLFD